MDSASLLGAAQAMRCQQRGEQALLLFQDMKQKKKICIFIYSLALYHVQTCKSEYNF